MSASAKDISDKHYSDLLTYLANVPLLPRTSQGEVNRSAIAEACGFDRQVLYKNPRCRMALEEALAAKGMESTDTREERLHSPGDQVIAIRDRRIKQLEERIVTLQGELRDAKRRIHELETQLQSGKFAQELLLDSGRLPR